MDIKEWGIITKKISEGCFEYWLNFLERQSDFRISQRRAIDLLIRCCNACNAYIGEPHKLKEQDVIRTVKSITKIIGKVPSTEEFHTYLNSMYFIVKFLLKKDYALVLEMKEEIIPEFIPDTLSEQHKTMYGSLCRLIVNELVAIVTNSKMVDVHKIIPVGYLLSNILVTSMNHHIFSDYINDYGACLLRLNVDLELQYQYFSFNHEKINNFIREESEGSVLHFIKYGMRIFFAYLNEGLLQESNEVLKKLLEIVPEKDEWVYFFELLKLCGHLIDSKITAEKIIICKKSLLKLKELYSNSEMFHTICKIISDVNNHYHNLCKKYDSKITYFSPEILIIVHEIYHEIVACFTYHPPPCRKKCKCSATRNVPLGTKTTVTITIFLNLYLSKNNLPNHILEKEISYLEKYCEFLGSLKNANCSNWDTCWSNLAPHMYNLGVRLLRKEMYEGTLQLGHMFLKYYLLLEKLEDQSILPDIMCLLSSSYMKQKNYVDAASWTAMEIINTKEECRRSAFKKFLQIKTEAKKDGPAILQEYTIVSVIEQTPAHYKCFLTHISDNKQLQIDLLIAELEMYHQIWKSKIPITAAFRRLYDIADNITLMRVFVNIFSDWDIRIPKKLLELLENVFSEFELSLKTFSTKNYKLMQVVLNFFRYKNQIAEIISKNFDEMRNANNIKPLTADSDIGLEDCNDVCDIVSRYETLKVGGDKLKRLEECLSNSEELLGAGITNDLFTEISIDRLYTLIKNIAFQFGLHSDIYNLLKALFLALNIAEFSGNRSFVLECSGYILKYFEDSEMEKKLENVILHVKSENDYTCLAQYYVNICEHYISIKNFPIALKYFNIAVNYLSLCPESKANIFCDIALELLRFKLMQFSCNSKMTYGIKFSFGPILRAYNLILDKYCKDPEWTSCSLMILFDVHEICVKMYHDLKMPREVRYFGMAALSIAQSHVIPIKSARILNYLAHADFRNDRLDDFRVKIDGISEILGLENGNACLKSYVQENVLSLPSVNEISEGIAEIMLDQPNPKVFNMSSPLSPVCFEVQPYKHPSFITHKFCKCLLCTSFEYHQLAISYFHLEALWYARKRRTTLASSFFKGSSEFYKIITTGENVMSKITNNNQSITRRFRNIINTNFELNFTLKESYYSCLLDYVKFLYSSNALEAAGKCSETLLNELEPDKMAYPNLYGEALLEIIGFSIKESSEIKGKLKLYSSKKIKNEDRHICATPKNCPPELQLIKLKPAKIVQRPKVLKFNLTDFDSDDVNQATPSNIIKNQNTPLKTPRDKLIPPSLRVANTPNFKTPANEKLSNEDNNMKKSRKIPSARRKPMATKIFPDAEDGNKRTPLAEIPEPLQKTGLTISSESIKTDVKIIRSELKLKSNLIEVSTKKLTSRLRKQKVESVVSGDSCSAVEHIFSEKDKNKTNVADSKMPLSENAPKSLRRTTRKRPL